MLFISLIHHQPSRSSPSRLVARNTAHVLLNKRGGLFLLWLARTIIAPTLQVHSARRKGRMSCVFESEAQRRITQRRITHS
ncbi:hypothetical protein BDW59DRAFT_146920, partial [Aspergillus cavernicola]